MRDVREWWRTSIPEGCDFVTGVEEFYEHLFDVLPCEIGDEQRYLLILTPEGRTDWPVPASHEAWLIFIDLLDVAWPAVVNGDEGPRPVVLIDLTREDKENHDD